MVDGCCCAGLTSRGFAHDGGVRLLAARGSSRDQFNGARGLTGATCRESLGWKIEHTVHMVSLRRFARTSSRKLFWSICAGRVAWKRALSGERVEREIRLSTFLTYVRTAILLFKTTQFRVFFTVRLKSLKRIFKNNISTCSSSQWIHKKKWEYDTADKWSKTIYVCMYQNARLKNH